MTPGLHDERIRRPGPTLWGGSVLLCVLSACASVEDRGHVDGRSLADLRPTPFHIAVRSVRALHEPAATEAMEDGRLPCPTKEQLARWNAEIARRLEQWQVSSVRVEPSDTAIESSPYDLGVEIELQWRSALHEERHNLVGSLLAWGFLWPFSVTSVAAVEDRSYSTPTTATIRLVWAGARHESVCADLGPLLLSLPQRQPSIWWKLVAFSPIYFWVPDDPAQRTESLYSALLDRLAIEAARLIKIDGGRVVDRFFWEGDCLVVEPPAEIEVSVLGSIRSQDGAKSRFVVPREASRIRMHLHRAGEGGREAWTQTILRPR